MPTCEIRPFRRSDRAQLTDLVNAHVEAVLPGVTVSANRVLGQLERDPGEYVVDPWVTWRDTLVAVQRDRVVAATHLLRYGSGDVVGTSLRGAGEIRWLVFWPAERSTTADCSARDVAADGSTPVPAGPGRARTSAVDDLVRAAVARLRSTGATTVLADGGLPAPGIFGIPDRWPHVAAALERAGFVAGEREEIVLAAHVDDLPRGGPAPVDGLELRVGLGGHATRFTAVLDGADVGFYEVASDLTEGGALSRLAGWAEGWELWVAPGLRRRGIATWLLGHAADRLRFAGVQRVLDGAVTAPDADGTEPFLRARGYRELARTRRGWTLG